MADALQNLIPDADRPQWRDYSRCVHCGLCLNACPTFRLLGEEMDSPRGRIYQIAPADAGRMPLAQAAPFLDRCLDCRACETACPSGVEYGKILEAARAQLACEVKPNLWRRLLAKHLYDQVLPSHVGLKTYAALLRLAQTLGLERLAEKFPAVNPFGLNQALRLAPRLSPRPFWPAWGKTYPAQGPRRARVGLLAGCMQNVASAELSWATLRVLQRNGCEVVVAQEQTCCGALHVHAGRREKARQLARRNIQAFAALECDAYISHTAGCGASLKEYGHLLASDAQWSEAARQFAEKVRDISEFLVELGPLAPGLGSLPVTVTYQDPCHLAHAQRIRSAPRQLLAAIPGLELIEMARPDQCCGSAGVYNLLQPELAGRLGREKLESAAQTRARWLVTANPGCQLQLAALLRQAGSPQPVLHVIEVLDRAYRGGSIHEG